MTLTEIEQFLEDGIWDEFGSDATVGALVRDLRRAREALHYVATRFEDRSKSGLERSVENDIAAARAALDAMEVKP